MRPAKPGPTYVSAAMRGQAKPVLDRGSRRCSTWSCMSGNDVHVHCASADTGGPVGTPSGKGAGTPHPTDRGRRPQSIPALRTTVGLLSYHAELFRICCRLMLVPWDSAGIPVVVAALGSLPETCEPIERLCLCSSAPSVLGYCGASGRLQDICFRDIIDVLSTLLMCAYP